MAQTGSNRHSYSPAPTRSCRADVRFTPKSGHRCLADSSWHLICNAGRERQEADMIATPTWMLEGRTFAPATSAARASTQFVAGSVWSP
jgi:hypothetical protein